MRRVGWLLTALLLAAGCASHSGQGIEIETDPAGAVAVAGDQKVKTPGKIYAPNTAAEMEVQIQKDGFEIATVTLRKDSESFGACLSQGLGAGLMLPQGAPISITELALQYVEQLVLLAANCELKAGGLRPDPVFVTLRPVPLELRGGARD